MKFMFFVLVALAIVNAAFLTEEQLAAVENNRARFNLLSGSGSSTTVSDTTIVDLACARGQCVLTYTLGENSTDHTLIWGADSLHADAQDVADGTVAYASGVCAQSPCVLTGLPSSTDVVITTVSTDGVEVYPNSGQGDLAGDVTTPDAAPSIVINGIDDVWTGVITAPVAGTAYVSASKCCCYDCNLAAFPLCSTGECRIPSLPSVYRTNVDNHEVVVGENVITDGSVGITNDDYGYQVCVYTLSDSLQSEHACIMYSVPDNTAPVIDEAASSAVAEHNDGEFSVVVAIVVDDASTVSYTDNNGTSGSFDSTDGGIVITGLDEDTEYTFEFVATTDANGDGITWVVIVATPDVTAPVVTVEASATIDAVTFTVTSDEPATIYYGVAPADAVVYPDDLTAECPDGTCVQGDLEAGTDYIVYAVPVDASGNIGEMVSVAVSTEEPLPNTAHIVGGEDTDFTHGDSLTLTGTFIVEAGVPAGAAVIEAAELKFVATPGQNIDGAVYTIAPVDQAWSEQYATATCSVFVDGACAGQTWDLTALTTSGTGVFADGQLTFDITADVEAIIAGGDNYGWVIIADDDTATFYSSESDFSWELVVTYPDGAVADKGIANDGPICQDDSATITCATGVISISSAMWGRQNDIVCQTANGFDTTNTECAAENAFAVASGLCNGQASCTIAASTAVFGEPCASTHKYLEGRYVCVDASVISDFCASANPCQNGAACINSAEGAVCSCTEGFEGVHCETEINPVVDDLVLHLSFDDETATDHASGHATTVFKANPSNGVLGRGFGVGIVNGNSYVSAENSDALATLGDDWTVAFWVAPATVGHKGKKPHTSTGNTAQFCEQQRETISCPPGRTLQITEADYGRTDSTTCLHRAMSNTNCHASSAFRIASQKCNGEKSCELHASNGVFGDPCVGTFKYMTVSYECVSQTKFEVYAGQGGFIRDDVNRQAESFSIYQEVDHSTSVADHLKVMIARTQGPQYLAMPTSVTQDEWNFVAVTFTASGEQVLYVNGAAVVESQNLGPMVASTKGFFLGNDGGNAAEQANAYFDEVKIWSSALTAEQVAAVRSEGVGAAVDPPVPEDDGSDEGSDPTDPLAGNGCADGTVEGFEGEEDISACAGAYTVPGVVSAETFQPQCSRNAGNDGTESQGCSITDLCQVGFHVCLSAAEVRHKTSDNQGCTAATTADFDYGFFATRQSSAGYGRCSENGQNDIFGCGAEGVAPYGNCEGLNTFTHNQCSQVGNGWTCHGGEIEATNIVHSSNVGGVMCCRDDSENNNMPVPKTGCRRVAMELRETPRHGLVDFIVKATKSVVRNHQGRGSSSSSSSSSSHSGRQPARSYKPRRHGGSFPSVSVRGCKKKVQSNPSNRNGRRGRRLLQDDVQSTVVYFDISPTTTTTADQSVEDLYAIIADRNSEFMTTYGDLVTSVSREGLLECTDGSYRSSCSAVATREQVVMPQGVENSGYPVDSEETLANDSPVVIALIATVSVLIVGGLAALAYRFRHSDKEVSFDGRLADAAVPSEKVEMDVVPSAAAVNVHNSAEQHTYWVFNKDSNV